MSEPVITVRDLTKRYGDFTAVDGVSFDVEPGEIFGYLGANGAGKSTTIRMLCGLVAPSGGHARVAGHDIATASQAVRRSIGYMSQKFSLYLDLSVRHNLEFFGGVYGLSGRGLRERIAELAAELELHDHMTERTGALAGGVRQRVALACSLLHRPRVVFLDEPTAGVDPPSRRGFWRVIRGLSEAGTTVFVTTHYMDEAEYCGRVGLMVAGRLVALDTPSGLKRRHVPGRMLQVAGPVDRALVERLRALSSVLAVQPFGRGLHVQVTEGVELEGVNARLVEPTLEDVFLAVVAAHERQEAA